MCNRTLVAVAALLLALSAAAKPKRVFSDYNHVGVLFLYVTGADQHGPNVYHVGGYTCITYQNSEYGPDCSEDTALLEFRTDDGKEHMALRDPTDFKAFMKNPDVLKAISIEPKNHDALWGTADLKTFKAEMSKVAAGDYAAAATIAHAANEAFIHPPGVKFAYRTDGKLIYVPFGKTDKRGNIHVSGETAYPL
jgi:hypothetical protein